MNILLEKINKDKNHEFLVESNNTHIHSSGRLIVGIGLKDITIVDETDATLIFKKGNSEKVRSVVKDLKEANKTIAKEHSFEYRPVGKI